MREHSNMLWNKLLVMLLLPMSFIGLATSHFQLSQKITLDLTVAHNVARAAVGVGPIAWSSDLAAYAKIHARKMWKTCEMVHTNGTYGENIAIGDGRFGALDAMKLWLDEKPNYDYESNRCVGDQCLHYTQIVWRKSVRFGCAKIRCKNGWRFVQCNYDPPGNVIGKRPY